jgi:ferredoxin
MSRIVVDTSRCEGHGLCEGIAPDVFALHDEGAVEVLIKESVAGDAIEAAGTAAALACPVAAIHVTG